MVKDNSSGFQLYDAHPNQGMVEWRSYDQDLQTFGERVLGEQRRSGPQDSKQEPESTVPESG